MTVFATSEKKKHFLRELNIIQNVHDSVQYCDILYPSGSSHDGSWRSVDEAFTPLLSFYEVNIKLKRENKFIC